MAITIFIYLISDLISHYAIDNLYYLSIPLVLSARVKRASVTKRGFNNLTSTNISDNLVSYLAGLLEGDGSLNTPKVFKTPTGKARVAAIEIVFAIIDKPSALLLKSIFGGNVYDHSKKNITRLMIQDFNNVTNIVSLVNGKFRTPKINALHNMIDYLNAKGANIVKLPLDTSPLNSNA